MATAAVEIFQTAHFSGRKPDPLLTVSEWADHNRELSSTVASEPGRWRTKRTPYLREIMDCLSPSSPIETVVFMKGAQIGATEAGNNWVGYIVDQAPGPLLIVLPTVETAKRWSKQRLAHLIDDTPCLRNKVADSRERDSGNTILSKEFPGGIMVITGANSAVGLRSMPARYLLFDEIDGFPGDVDGEGSPTALAEKRSATFRRRKILKISTPTIEGLSAIQQEFERSDQRYFYVACPLCGEYQTLRFPQIRWPEGRPDEAKYECEFCKELIDERYKTSMLEGGEFRATKPSNGRVAGFHLSSLYSPVGWFSWADAAITFERVHKDPSLLKVFVNTVLGETWKDKGEAPEWELLMQRRESYQPGLVPLGGLFLTAGVDVQRDRLEVEVKAWGRGRESWSVDYQILEGKTSDPEVWGKLDALRASIYTTENGHALPISRMFVDSGDGTTTNDVYNWVRSQPVTQVAAIKGADTGIPVGQPSPVEVTVSGKKIKAGLKIRMINVSFFKSELYADLKKLAPTEEQRASGAGFPPGYCHFPSGKNYGDEHFKQLCSEQLVTRVDRSGRTKVEWQQIRARNEALDTSVYARAAAWDLGLDRMQEAHWQNLEGQLQQSRPAPKEQPRQAPQSQQSAQPQTEQRGRDPFFEQRRGSSWLGRGGGWMRKR